MNFDHYVYPGTNVLRNKAGIMDAAQFETEERRKSNAAIADMQREGVTGKFDVAHIQDIHRRLFGDVYDWAGEFREIQTWKGGTEFCAPEDIQGELEKLCRDIKGSNYFRGMPKDETGNALAGVMARLNKIHPFREGNGRTQRMFLGQLAMNAGYDLDFSRMTENDMRNASIMADRGRTNLMEYLFRSSLEKVDYDGPVRANDTGPEKTGVPKQAKPSAWSSLKALLKGTNRPKDAGRDGPER